VQPMTPMELELWEDGRTIGGGVITRGAPRVIGAAKWGARKSYYWRWRSGTVTSPELTSPVYNLYTMPRWELQCEGTTDIA
jgi:hypothetical protein